MTQDTTPPAGDEDGTSSCADGGTAPETSRRDVLKAVGKYSAFLAGTSAVLLSADDVLAQSKSCSPPGNSGRNGNGPPAGKGWRKNCD